MMAVNDQDQPHVGPMILGGVMAAATPELLKTVARGNVVYTFSRSYVYHWGDGPIHFRRGWSYVLDTRLRTALVSAGAPMTVA